MIDKKLDFPFYALPQSLTARKDLKASDKVIFSVIRDYQGCNGSSWPGIRKLSSNTGLAFSTIIESIRRLEAKKILKVERPRSGKSSRYIIIESALETRTVKRSENPNGHKDKALGKPNTGALETRTEALGNSEPNQTDLLNQTYIRQFDEARKIYPGTKRGLETEFKNFQKKHKDWKEALPLLQPAIEQQSRTIWTNCEKKYIPHFQTWLNQRRWEFECPTDTNTTVPFDHESAKQRDQMLAGRA